LSEDPPRRERETQRGKRETQPLFLKPNFLERHLRFYSKDIFEEL